MKRYANLTTRELELLVKDERIAERVHEELREELEGRHAKDRERPLDRVARTLAEARPDIVALAQREASRLAAAPVCPAPIVLRLPLPPSANAAWRAVNGRILLSREARRWKREAAAAIKDQRAARFIAGRVTVEIDATFSRKRRDLDNVAKLAIDAVKGVCMEDDSQVYAITLRKHVGAQPGLVLAIYANEQERAA